MAATTDRGWDLTAAARDVIAFRDARDWAQFHLPKNLVAGLAIEAAELQELFLWDDPRTADDVRLDRERVARIAQEMADVTVYLLTLAADLGINLAEAVSDKLQDNARRYPVDQYRGSAEKAPH